MPTVIIAGGTSPSLGHSLVTATLSLTPHWTPIILSRPSSHTPPWLTPLLATTRVSLLRVDYADHAALVSVLRSAHAHTVISVLASFDEHWFTTQVALLQAAKEAGVRRFAPSEFGVGVRGTLGIEMLRGNVRVWEACGESGLEWTRFECGLFVNYLGFGVRGGAEGEGDAEGARREEALGGREGDGEWFYYASECRAELPVKSDGSFPRVTLTAVEDVGKFVARSLDLPLGSWESTSYMVGETLRMDEVVQIAENVMGKKWEIRAVTQEELEARIEHFDRKGDATRKMWAQLGLVYTRDVEGEGWLEGRLNGLFPDVRPLSVEGYLRKYYG